MSLSQILQRMSGRAPQNSSLFIITLLCLSTFATFNFVRGYQKTGMNPTDAPAAITTKTPEPFKNSLQLYMPRYVTLTPDPKAPPSQTGPATGQFSISGGRIYDPSGKLYVAKGINVADWAAVGYGAPGNIGNGTNSGTFLRQLMPKVNAVRLNAQGANVAPDAGSNNYKDSPAGLLKFVKSMTNAKVVVIIEDHVGNNRIPSGSRYNDEMQWYKNMAAYYKNNPYVWFGTMNEPWGNPTTQVMQQELDIYKAIRSTGNNAPVLMEISNPPNAWTTNWNNQGAYFQNMRNVAWDVHVYNLPGSNQREINVSMANVVSAVQTGTYVKSADGVMPVIVGEYGPALSSDTQIERNGPGTVLAVQNANVSGSMAWAWSVAPSSDAQNQGYLTDYGKELNRYFSGNPPTSWTFSNIPK